MCYIIFNYFISLCKLEFESCFTSIKRTRKALLLRFCIYIYVFFYNINVISIKINIFWCIIHIYISDHITSSVFTNQIQRQLCVNNLFWILVHVRKNNFYFPSLISYSRTKSSVSKMSKQLSGVPEVSKNPLPGKQGWIAWSDLGSISINKNTKTNSIKMFFFTKNRQIDTKKW